MRIAMIGTRGVPAHYGGFETAVEEIGSRLAAGGHVVTVYCRRGNNGPDGDPATYAGMRLVHLPCLHQRSLETLTHTAVAALHVALSRGQYDVALVFNAANTFALPLLHLSHLPVAVHVDGLEWRRSKWGRAGKAFYLWSEARAVRDADALIADSPGIQEYYLTEFGAQSRLLEYGTTVTADLFPSRVGELGLEPRRYHLLVARVEPENHVLEMIEAYAASGARLPLVVVGDSPYVTDYREAVRATAGRTPGVRLLGSVWDQDLLDQLYVGAASYLHGHSVGGTNPSLLRAMGAGATTIAHDNTFNRDVLGEDGVFGRTVHDLAEAIAAVDVDPDSDGPRRARLVARCRKRYVWGAVAEGYTQLCSDLAAGRTQRHLYSGRRDPSSPWHHSPVATPSDSSVER
ncbi:glycosyltransferase [Janibacter sp. GS2]|uniref:glycosyltransferase n=1 Tax=Janibacter sp. GS2 TaxID=3442646 RepID=UPI003EB87A59